MLERLFGSDDVGPIPGDLFGLAAMCENVGLGKRAREIVGVSRRAIEVRLEELDSALPHTASRIGGHPALPDDTSWPLSRDGEPLLFLAQFSCGELSREGYDGLPDEGILSIFLDTFTSRPREARVFHYSLTRDMTRRAPPNSSTTEKIAYRPTFDAKVTLPKLGSPDYESLDLDLEERELYILLLGELDGVGELSPLQMRGYPLMALEPEAVPPTKDVSWELFLSIQDMEEIFLSWPEEGCALLFIPTLETRFRKGRAHISWQSFDLDEDWDDWEDDERWG